MFKESKKGINIRNPFIQKVWRLVKIVLVTFLLLTIFIVILFRFISPPFTYLMLQRESQGIYSYKNDKIAYEWIDIEKISPSVKEALIISEDQKFYMHFGIDFVALYKAIEYNCNNPKGKVKGASTITQQVAKNLFLYPSRSYLRKILELYFTLLIELFWSKERILEMYLNIAEMGKGLYGIKKTAEFYYKKAPSKLTIEESAAIIAILPNPTKRSPLNITPYLNSRINYIVGMKGKVLLK